MKVGFKMDRAENEFFLLTESDLLNYSSQMPDKPLAYAFYCYLYQNDILKHIQPSNIQNFLNKIHFDSGALEVRFNDDSVFVLLNGVVNVFKPSINYFASFNFS